MYQFNLIWRTLQILKCFFKGLLPIILRLSALDNRNLIFRPCFFLKKVCCIIISMLRYNSVYLKSIIQLKFAYENTKEPIRHNIKFLQYLISTYWKETFAWIQRLQYYVYYFLRILIKENFHWQRNKKILIVKDK